VFTAKTSQAVVIEDSGIVRGANHPTGCAIVSTARSSQSRLNPKTIQTAFQIHFTCFLHIHAPVSNLRVPSRQIRGNDPKSSEVRISGSYVLKRSIGSLLILGAGLTFSGCETYTQKSNVRDREVRGRLNSAGGGHGNPGMRKRTKTGKDAVVYQLENGATHRLGELGGSIVPGRN
jgi:hypothetical protein